jgi:hypothetical protein
MGVCFFSQLIQRVMNVQSHLVTLTLVFILCAILKWCPVTVFIWPEENKWDTDYHQHDIQTICNRVERCKSGKLLAEFLKNQKYKHTVGFIYMFQSDSYVGKLKIGRTSKHIGVNNRMKQWIKQCKSRLNMIKKWHVKHHEFCEKMIHEELKLKNHWCGKLKCPTCKAFHTEYFKGGDIVDVFDVIEFWVTFFNGWNRELNSMW